MGSTSNNQTSSTSYDLSFKVLLIGDSGVGKSSLLVSFISNSLEDLSPTIGKFSFFFQRMLSEFHCICINLKWVLKFKYYA